MNRNPDIDTDAFQSIGSIVGKMVDGMKRERAWDGKTITKNGVYSGISLDDYHGKRDLLDGPSISKSALKHLIPAMGGSPKAFWGRWQFNPDHIEQDTSKALDFGKAAHCLLLGDEVFEERFALRPKKAPDGREWHHANASCIKWVADQKGKTIITLDQYERIRRIHADAKDYPIIKAGLLNGRIERSMLWKDPETGIWLRARPDALPNADGVYADLKTSGKFDEDFLERQIFDAGYYLQAAITRMVCRGLGLPFETFVLLYVLNDDVPDTAHVEIDQFDIDRGERVVRWCLKTIRRCLDTGEWPGARPFNDGERRIQMKVWAKDRLENFLEIEDRREAA
ncbi:PD-(D/E)XK nuclease-like domain-containing protein [Shinella zoogloeoides]